MFKFLKDKLKGAVESLSEKVDEEGEELEVEEAVEETESEEKPVESTEAEETQEPISEAIKEETEEVPEDKEEPTEPEKVIEEKPPEEPIEKDTEETLKEEPEEEKVEETSNNKVAEAPKAELSGAPEPEKEAEPTDKEKSEATEPETEVIEDYDESHHEEFEKKGFFAKIKEKLTTEKAEEHVEEEKPEDILEPVVEETQEEAPETEEVPQQIEEQPKETKEETEPEIDKEQKPEPVTEEIPNSEVARNAEPSSEIKVESEPEVPTEKKQEEPTEIIEEVPKEETKLPPEKKPEVLEEAKGFFGKLKQKVVAKKLSDEQFDELFWDLELVLLENNVSVEVIEKIKTDLKAELVEKPIARAKVQSTIINTLRKSVTEAVSIESFDLLEKIKTKKPFVICFIGINGSGKTTSIAKVANLLQQNNLSCVMAAADTFRAAAIDQLQTHADNLDIKLIKHDYGSDAAAVAFDAVKHAEAKQKDVVLIDTAGRLHSNTNLMDELAKVVKIAKPDLKIFVGESITGNDCVEQAQKFDEAVGVDGIILSKADVDEKGGTALSIAYVTQKPILYLGTGQEYTDLTKFNSDIFIKSLGL